MKKAIFLTIFLSLSLTALQAQTIKIGAKAGLSSTGVSSDKLNDFIEDNTVGFYAGPTVEVRLNEKLGLDLSALYSQKGIKFKGEETRRTNYIEIPLEAKYFISLNDNLKVFGGAGPYINFRISGDKTFEAITDEVKGQWEAKNFGAGLNFKGGFEISSLLQIGTNYGLGLTDNYKASNGNFSAKERVWSFFASVYF